ncbi:MAG: hypothetical protein KDA32_12385 [Phycisphaerales bacterium]|nr:hypothetical protein [Phycisphaerales bacterium]
MSADANMIEFADSMRSAFERRDYVAADRVLRDAWTASELLEFLESAQIDHVRMAAWALGIVGSQSTACRLVALLGHNNDDVAAVAEEALWHLWMRGGSPESVERLALGVRALRSGNDAIALDILSRLCDLEPPFAEAHHQRGLALHGLERINEAAKAYAETARLNRYHFAALATLGHIAVERDEYAAAVSYYRRALHLHPRLTEIREILPALEAALADRIVA